ncbi:MAG: hypothetical protein JRJ03_13215, partial [Deltaproteobacteria bacterium]|nr:hypothetical protein [Deltaproteobacteria bacterium]
TIPAGDTSGTISVPITDDALIELAETFYVNLSNASANATIGDNQGVGTINVQEQAVITIDNVTVDENTGTADFTVTLSGAAEDPVTVQYATSDGTATVAGGDYTSKSGTLTIGAGSTTGTISVPIADDSLVELTERFFLDLSNPSANAAFGDNRGQCTINIDEQATITINDVTVDENAGTADFTVTLSVAAEDDVTVDYATSDGTATAGSDYSATSGTLTINAGDTSGTISVPITDDAMIELAETFYVNLSSPSANAAFGDNQGVGTINVQEQAVITIDNVSADEGGIATFTVSLSGAAEDAVTVQYSTSGGSATEGSDYSATNGTLTIPAGSDSGTISVPIADDALIELAETFYVNLSSPSANATIGDNQGVGTINVQEKAVITIDNVSADEGGSATFTVTLSGAAEDAVTVQYSTSGGSATEGSDYTATSSTLTIPAGDTSGTISVPITDDALIELAETFYVNLSNASANASWQRPSM